MGKHPCKVCPTSRSVGAFLTHCGWNVMVESISGGVPVMCCPFFAEQQTNCRYSLTAWGMGMEVSKDVKREDIRNLVKEVMEGEKGKRLRDSARSWRKKAEDAYSPWKNHPTETLRSSSRTLLHCHYENNATFQTQKTPKP